MLEKINSVLPLILYLIGSLFFVAGSILSIVRTIKGAG